MRRPGRNALGPAGWPPLLARCGAGTETVQPGLGAELAGALDSILAAWPADLPVGHIHADLFPDNVFFLEGAISGLIDFYFAATDLLAYDVAVCLNAWCFEPDVALQRDQGAGDAVRLRRRARAVGGGARGAAGAVPGGGAAVPAHPACIDWVNTPPGALVTRKDPIEYLRRLRFHLTARDAHAYGI